jgi:hypothetical protein
VKDPEGDPELPPIPDENKPGSLPEGRLNPQDPNAKPATGSQHAKPAGLFCSFFLLCFILGVFFFLLRSTSSFQLPTLCVPAFSIAYAIQLSCL